MISSRALEISNRLHNSALQYARSREMLVKHYRAIEDEELARVAPFKPQIFTDKEVKRNGSLEDDLLYKGMLTKLHHEELKV